MPKIDEEPIVGAFVSKMIATGGGEAGAAAGGVMLPKISAKGRTAGCVVSKFANRGMIFV